MYRCIVECTNKAANARKQGLPLVDAFARMLGIWSVCLLSWRNQLHIQLQCTIVVSLSVSLRVSMNDDYATLEDVEVHRAIDSTFCTIFVSLSASFSVKFSE